MITDPVWWWLTLPILAFVRLRQEECKLQACLSYVSISCLNETKHLNKPKEQVLKRKRKRICCYSHAFWSEGLHTTESSCLTAGSLQDAVRWLVSHNRPLEKV